MRQKRVLLYVHDGSGLGHLRRVSRIAETLQGTCATLIVTGQREALWIIPESCEFVHIPNWDQLLLEKANYWNRTPWLELDRANAAKLKSDFFWGVVNAFSPDAILVDYLPLGKGNELERGLRSSPARKYLINRGIVDTVDFDMIYGEGLQQYIDLYDRILITADKTLFDTGAIKSYNATLKEKIAHVGYITPKAPDVDAIRQERGLDKNQKWVVCSAGGGKHGELFLEHCIDVAAKMPDVFFDVVFGPKSKKRIAKTETIGQNIAVRKDCKDLSMIIGACDIAVINGGYNSTMEAIAGGAHIIIYPNQRENGDEQITNANLLASYYPISLLADSSALEATLLNMLDRNDQLTRPGFPLNANGLSHIKEILFNDLDIRS